jgi:hypothetical protein
MRQACTDAARMLSMFLTGQDFNLTENIDDARTNKVFGIDLAPGFNEKMLHDAMRILADAVIASGYKTIVPLEIPMLAFEGHSAYIATCNQVSVRFSHAPARAVKGNDGTLQLPELNRFDVMVCSA